MKFRKRNLLWILLLIIVTLYFTSFFYNIYKPLPENVSYEGSIYNVSENEVEFLRDLNYLNESNSTVLDQEIFDNVFSLIDNSQKFIIIDMFLFNTDYSNKERFIPLTTEMKDKLIEKKKQNPDMAIVLITDEINNFYGSYTSKEIAELKENRVEVVITDLTKLRDSNPIYSSFWRIFLQPFGTSGRGWITHPLGNTDYEVTLRSILKVLNTKANHRKLIVADSGSEIHTIITSANPHEASSLHSNVALLIKEDIWKDVLETEKSVVGFSSSTFPKINTNFVEEDKEEENIEIQFLTEGKIKDNLIRDINSMKKGEKIDIAMFYLSERDIIDSLLKASEKGVEIRLILDPNKDAFAREKKGIPNRQVAYELVRKSAGKIKVRWYDTQGEQFHVKMITLKKPDKTIVYLGSANLTRRNINDYNLEANVKLASPTSANISKEVVTYFNTMWENKDGHYTIDFSKYEEPSRLKYLQYRFQEFSGISTF